MDYRSRLRSVALVLPAGALIVACEGEPVRTYYNDLEDGNPGLYDATTDVASSDVASADGTFDTGPPSDAEEDASGEDATSRDDASMGPEASLHDAARDGPVEMEASVDAHIESGAESGVEAGCVTNNCGACGQPMCAHGCCTVTASNPSGCAIEHNGGYDTYYDCEALGTDDLQAAMDACTIYTGNVADCASYPCTPAALGSVVCSQGSMSQICICWSFKRAGKTSSTQGYVDNSGSLPGPTGDNCFCPDTTVDPTWD
jgi:hypothetical protein